jgi:microcompartment protein CcmK/EutM
VTVANAHTDRKASAVKIGFQRVEWVMVLAKVVGTVVSSQKERSMESLRFMVVEPVDVNGKPAGAHVVAIDAVGSGPGEYVLYATGSSARQTQVTDKKPCDAVIMAIVDQWEIDGEVKYRKADGKPA